MASTISAGLTTTTALVYSADTSGVLQLQTNGTTTAVTIDTSQNVTFAGKLTSASSLVLASNGTTTAVTIDTAQNVGVGVTPPTIQTGFSNISLGYAGNFIADKSSVGGLNILQNAYRNSGGTYTYVGTAPAEYYQMYNGQHAWYIAGSGTAGNTISFTQAMTLNNSGQLLVGATSFTGTARVMIMADGTYATLECQAPGTGSYGQIQFVNGNGGVGSIVTNGSTTTYNITSDRRLKSNITSLTSSDSGPIIDALLPRKFNWNADGSTSMGFITDEYQNQFPGAITGQPNATTTEEYEITPAIKDEQGNITTPAVMGTRTVPVYQQGDFSTSEFMAVLVAEIQSLRARLKAANIA